jgi:Ydr279p protein family (RNase H2 complex component) wHTH domain
MARRRDFRVYNRDVTASKDRYQSRANTNQRHPDAIPLSIRPSPRNNTNINTAHKTLPLRRPNNYLRSSLHTLRRLTTDGSIYLATPEDSLFHLLPILQKHTTQHSLPLPDIHDLLPPPLQKCTPQNLIETLCQCTKSTTPEFVPDTYKLCPEKVLRILVRKVDALVPVLGASLVDEFVEKPLALVIGQDPPSNISVIRDLARRRCAIDFISANLSDHFSSLLSQSTE